VSVHEGVDTSTPNGRLVFGIFGSIEQELIRGRVRSGIAAAKAKGISDWALLAITCENAISQQLSGA